MLRKAQTPTAAGPAPAKGLYRMQSLDQAEVEEQEPGCVLAWHIEFLKRTYERSSGCQEGLDTI